MSKENKNQFLHSFASLTSMTLVNRLKTTDDEAWHTLNRLYRPLVHFWCRRAKVANGDVDDVVQEVFRSVFGGIEKFNKSKESDSFRAWLWTISRNKIKDYFKKNYDKAVGAGGTDAQLHIQQLPEREPMDFDSDFANSESPPYQALSMVQEEVQESTFQAFWRSTIDDVAPDAVAQELAISVDSVYQAKSRVLRRLRQLLE